MPDSFNRYSLLRLENKYLRNLASVRVMVVDPITGQESGTTYLGLNQQFSAQNLSKKINSSLTKTSPLLINAENDKIFAKEVFYDASPGVLQYAFPPDYMQLRGLWWNHQLGPRRPDAYRLMSMQDNIETRSVGLGRSRTARFGGWVATGNLIATQGILVRA